jgi:N-acetyl sugar amidotransferase
MRCVRCIYDNSVFGIYFNDIGVCNYCILTDKLKLEYGTGHLNGKEIFSGIVKKIKHEGRKNKYDVIIGVSGGTDSSFLLHLSKELGLRPLAVHFDNTWNSAIATQNIYKVISRLNIDLYTYVVNNLEMCDIVKSFFLSGVPELDCATDLAFAQILNQVAKKFNINYVFEGHSFTAEGITPIGLNYFDGKYIKSIHNRYGNTKIKSYPLMTFTKFLTNSCFNRIYKIRPLWYLEYSKANAKKLLSKQYSWNDYGGHHLENRLSAFLHSVYLPKKFGIDMRNNQLSAEVREGVISREEAIAKYSNEVNIEAGLVEYFIKRLGLTEKEYNKVMSSSPKYWYEFPTYKKRFERLRPLFYLLAKSNLVPMSFYLKYCFPIDTKL